MSIMPEFTQNAIKLSRCKKIYTVTFFYYIAGSIGFLLYGIIGLVSVGADKYIDHVMAKAPITPVTTFFLLDALLTAPLTAFLGYKVNVEKNDFSGICGTILHVINLIIIFICNAHHFFDAIKLPFYVTLVFSMLCATGFILLLRTNVVFRWLEQQIGYPYFSERMLEHEFDRKQMDIKSPYQIEMERRMKTASDSMNDIGSTDQVLEKYEATHIPSDMDSI